MASTGSSHSHPAAVGLQRGLHREKTELGPGRGGPAKFQIAHAFLPIPAAADNLRRRDIEVHHARRFAISDDREISR